MLNHTKNIFVEEELAKRRKKALQISKDKKKLNSQDVAYQMKKEEELKRQETIPIHERKYEEKIRNKKIEEIKDEIAEYLLQHHSSELKGAMFDFKIRKKLEPIISNYIKRNKIVIVGFDEKDNNELTKYMLNEIVGLGPIDEIIKQGEGKISEIWVNGLNPITKEIDVYYEKRGDKIKETNIKFRDQAHAMDIAKKIARNGSQQFGSSVPAANVRYPDGRVNLVRDPIATGGGGPYISFRLFPKDTLMPEDLLKGGSMNEEMYKLLRLAFRYGLNGIMVGPTGSGKTTLLTANVAFIPESERILVMEDTEEMRLRHKFPDKHIITEECKFNREDETKNYDLAFLTVNALRQKPDYMIYGEVRDKAAYDMLNGGNTGHRVWSTLHARSAARAVQRLINMVLEHGSKMDTNAIGKWVSESLDIIIFQKLYPDNVRRISEIIELTDFKDGKPVFNSLFKFIVEGKDENGKIIGNFYRTGRISLETAEYLIDEGADIEEVIPFVKKPDPIPKTSVRSRLLKYYEEE
ncbi:CpaF family protein [Calidifontibacillus erzurumensis]|uniref:CpaF family protein n=1 Tax=Calidifontibacillus erzurumensis TaxID=2741433 RepID=UPI0035B52B46